MNSAWNSAPDLVYQACFGKEPVGMETATFGLDQRSMARRSVSMNINGKHHGFLTAVASVARFLVKEVKWQANTSPDEWYDWLFFGFASLFQPSSTESSEIPSTVFLMFDTSDEHDAFDSKMIGELSRRLRRRTDIATLQHSPFGIYTMVMEPLLYFFDESLWGFRIPIRNLEKNRLSTDTATRERYEEMHELSRHIIHASETIDAASRVVERMAGCLNRCARGLDTASFLAGESLVVSEQAVSGASTSEESSRTNVSLHKASQTLASPNHQKPIKWTAEDQIQEDLSFYANFFKSLTLRASAFERRLENEIQLVHALTAD